MTVVRFKNTPFATTSFNNLLGDMWPQLPSLYSSESKNVVPVNIKEDEKNYLIELVAPGLTKDEFKIEIESTILTISTEVKEEVKKENENILQREHKLTSFKRSFTLDEKINAESISAQYINGVLIVSLPKKEEVKPSTKQISIS